MPCFWRVYADVFGGEHDPPALSCVPATATPRATVTPAPTGHDGTTVPADWRHLAGPPVVSDTHISFDIGTAPSCLDPERIRRGASVGCSGDPGWDCSTLIADPAWRNDRGSGPREPGSPRYADTMSESRDTATSSPGHDEGGCPVPRKSKRLERGQGSQGMLQWVTEINSALKVSMKAMAVPRHSGFPKPIELPGRTLPGRSFGPRPESPAIA